MIQTDEQVQKLTISLPASVMRRLGERAEHLGVTTTAAAESLVTDAVGEDDAASELTPELRRVLEERLAAGGPTRSVDEAFDEVRRRLLDRARAAGEDVSSYE